MIFTEQIFEAGKSINGGWSSAQMQALGLKTIPGSNNIRHLKGWKKRLIGSDIPEANVKAFLALKDKHLKNKKRSLKKRPAPFAPKKKCPYEYSRPGIQESTQTAKLLREINGQKQNLSQKEVSLFDKMVGQFSWTPEQADSIIKLHEKVCNITD